MIRSLAFPILLILAGNAYGGSWGAAKKHVYARDAGKPTIYCGCAWADKRVDLGSCGYIPRKNAKRAQRTEVEHIVPAARFGQGRECWATGGREHCYKHDQVFREMHNDPANLAVAVGEVNGGRSARPFGEVEGEPREYGACDFEIDGVAEPRPSVRRRIAATYLYFWIRYDMELTPDEWELFEGWLSE